MSMTLVKNVARQVVLFFQNFRLSTFHYPVKTPCSPSSTWLKTNLFPCLCGAMCLDHMQEIRQRLELELRSDWGDKKICQLCLEKPTWKDKLQWETLTVVWSINASSWSILNHVSQKHFSHSVTRKWRHSRTGEYGVVQRGKPSLLLRSSLGFRNANGLRDTWLSEDAIIIPTLQIRDWIIQKKKKISVLCLVSTWKSPVTVLKDPPALLQLMWNHSRHRPRVTDKRCGWGGGFLNSRISFSIVRETEDLPHLLPQDCIHLLLADHWLGGWGQHGQIPKEQMDVTQHCSRAATGTTSSKLPQKPTPSKYWPWEARGADGDTGPVCTATSPVQPPCWGQEPGGAASPNTAESLHRHCSCWFELRLRQGPQSVQLWDSGGAWKYCHFKNGSDFMFAGGGGLSGSLGRCYLGSGKTI